MSIPITDKYLLYKPGLGNEADIRVLNHNTDNIDNGMYQNRRMIGDAYDPESTASNPYMTDDLVVKQTTIYDESDNPQSYSFQYYRCLEDNVYGAWDATKWELTDIATELKRRSGGGASSLADLTDTDIDSPAEGEVLTYDGENWVNAEGSASVTKTAEGNPIEFDDGANAPLVKCVSAITGSQDLHGYDKPWVGGAGKNKLPLLLSKIKTFNTAGTWTGNTYVLNGIAYVFQSYDNETITGVNISSNGATGRSVIYYYRDDNASIVQSQTVTFSGIGGFNRCAYQDGTTWHESTQAYFTATITDGIAQIWCELLEGWSGSFTSAPQVEIGSSPTTFAPYSNICPITAYTEGEIEVSDGDGNTTTHTTTYPSAIYRGSEDAVNGEVSSEWITETLDGSSDEGWASAGSSGSAVGVYYILRSNIDGNGVPISDTFNGVSRRAYTALNLWEFSIPNDTSGGFNFKTDISTLSDFLTWLSNNPITIAYKLATPTTSSVTPTNLPIKSLSGYNHIESSTGDMEVEYITEEYQPIVDLIEENAVSDMTGATSSTDGTHGLVPAPEAGDEDKFLKGDGTWGEAGGSVAYSTTPKLIGTYNDGTNAYDLYEVTMVTSHSNPNGINFSYFPDDYSEIISIEGTFSGLIALSSRYYAPMGGWFKQSNDNINVTCSVYFGNFGTGNVRVYYAFHDQSTITPSGCSCDKQIITVRYTKTANRSLNLSKGEISGEKKKVDEEPIEEEKPVENDLDEWLEDSEEIEEEVDEGTDEDSDVEEEEENEATNE